MLALTRRKEKGEKSPFSIEYMAFTNLATKLFGTQASGVPLGVGFPYLKFAWEVEMSVGSGGESTGLFSSGPLVAKTCELPRFSIETQVVNVYNHKTIVQTKMNYEPITMTFYDQTNDVAESLIWDFVKGQFDPSDASKKPGIAPMTVTIKMKNLSGEAEDKVYTLLNAYITDAQHDTLDYATSDPVLWTITLRYEDLQTNEFKGKTPGDGGAGIKPLPKPPSKPSVTKVPVTKPPKADALVESGPSKWKLAGGEENGPLGAAWGNPNLTKQSANHRNKTQSAPEKTTFWPSPLSTNKDYPTNPAASVKPRPSDWKGQQVWDSKYGSGWNADGTSKKATATGTSTPSTGVNTAPTVTKTPDTPVRRVLSKKTIEANEQFIKQEAEYVKDDRGMNPEFKKAYLAGLEKYPPRGPGPQEQMISRKMAETDALRTAPRYASQVRTRNADGSFTDTYVPRKTVSTNNNINASSSQASKEQNYINRGKKPDDTF